MGSLKDELEVYIGESKMAKKKWKKNTVLVPFISKENTTPLKSPQGEPLRAMHVAVGKLSKARGVVYPIEAWYDHGGVMVSSGDTWSVVPWENSREKGPKIAEYVAVS